MSSIDPDLLSLVIDEKEDGILIHIEVKPASKTPGMEGINEWRKNLVIRVKAEAEKGRANKEVIQLFSSFLGIPQKNVIIIKGHRSHQKLIKISGMGRKELEKGLIRAIS